MDGFPRANLPLLFSPGLKTLPGGCDSNFHFSNGEAYGVPYWKTR